MTPRSDFLPFSAVVGQDDAKLALLLCALAPRIGGVLLRGDKGSGKTTLARGLAALLPGNAPFVELPVAATEDRVVGTLDLTAALTGGQKRFDPGLLSDADGGVLYVDEINLLPDHLVDVLLDVAASGVNRVEREGVSHSHSSRFVLVGSMNPEEGDLRPQLLDRFGLAVDVRTTPDPAQRVAALRRRLAFDTDGDDVRVSYGPADRLLAERLASAQPGRVPDPLLEAVSTLCADVGAEGLRADLTICRAAAALAGWEGRQDATPDDVRRVAPLALAHRARRDPLDPADFDRSRLDEALDRSLGSDGSGPSDTAGGGGRGQGGGDPGGRPEGPVAAPSGSGPGAAPERVADAVPASAPGLRPTGTVQETPVSGRGSAARSRRGRLVGDRPPEGAVTSVAVGATVRRAASRRVSGAADPNGSLVHPDDVRQAVRRERTANLIVVAVDGSGSMGASQRMEAAKGAVLALLRDAYQRRDMVALVAFRGEEAEVLLKPTSSVEVARARLAALPTGGRTPLAAGLRQALKVATGTGRREDYRPLIVVLTDARATAGPPGVDAISAAMEAGAEIRRAGVTSVVVDVEAAGPGRGALGLAARLASVMGADYVPMGDLSPSGLESVVRSAVALRG